MTPFPAEAIPDGTVLVAHHYTTGLLAALVPAAVVWDDVADREPVGLLVGVLAGLVGFVLMWPNPAMRMTGALVAGAGPLLAFASVARHRDLFGRGMAVLACLALLVAADDWLSHALGVWTPLDALYHVWMLGWLA